MAKVCSLNKLQNKIGYKNIVTALFSYTCQSFVILFFAQLNTKHSFGLLFSPLKKKKLIRNAACTSDGVLQKLLFEYVNVIQMALGHQRLTSSLLSTCNDDDDDDDDDYYYYY